MLIAALLYYLAGLFGFGGSDAPLVIDIKKPIKEHVADVERKTKALAINNTMQDQANAFSDDIAAKRKELSALHARRLATESDFEAVTTAIDAKRVALRAQIIAERMALKDLMTADEWAKVFAAGPSVKAAFCEASGGRAAMLTRAAASPPPVASLP